MVIYGETSSNLMFFFTLKVQIKTDKILGRFLVWGWFCVLRRFWRVWRQLIGLTRFGCFLGVLSQNLV